MAASLRFHFIIVDGIAVTTLEEWTALPVGQRWGLVVFELVSSSVSTSTRIAPSKLADVEGALWFDRDGRASMSP